MKRRKEAPTPTMIFLSSQLITFLVLVQGGWLMITTQALSTSPKHHGLPVFGVNRPSRFAHDAQTVYDGDSTRRRQGIGPCNGLFSRSFSSSWSSLLSSLSLFSFPPGEQGRVGQSNNIVHGQNGSSKDANNNHRNPCNLHDDMEERNEACPHQHASTSTSNSEAWQETWNWCQHFVVPYQLCPWAIGSVQTIGAIEIIVILPSSHGDDAATHQSQPPITASSLSSSASTSSWDAFRMEQAIVHAAQLFQRHVHQQHSRNHTTLGPFHEPPQQPFRHRQQQEQQHRDANTAITFIVYQDRNLDFDTFHQWFCDWEDTWITKGEFHDHNNNVYDCTENNVEAKEETRQQLGERNEVNEQQLLVDSQIYREITLAAFHPEWLYGVDDGGDHDDAIEKAQLVSLEKRSPYPTVSLVSSIVVDRAGVQATERIGEHNMELFCGGTRTLEEWNQIYAAAVKRKESSPNGP